MNLFKRTTASVALVALVSSVFATGVSAYSADEVAAASALAAKGYINTQTDVAGYNLSATITRSEIAKVAANVAELEANTTCMNNFADVSATTPNDWVCGYVEALLEGGLIAANANYNPNANLTKAEAVKLMLTVAGETVAFDAATWQADFVSYAVENGFVSSFSDYDTAATRGFTFSVAAAVTTEESGEDILGQLDDILNGEDDSTDTQTETPVYTGDSEVMVSLSPTTPDAGFVAGERARTALLAFDVTAGSEDITLDEASIEYIGLSDSDDFHIMAIYLNNEKITKGNSKSFDNDGEVDLSFENDTVIKAGETKTLVINGFVDNNSNVSHRIALTNLDASGNVEGDYVSSKSFSVVESTNVASLELNLDTEGSDIIVGETETLASFSLEASDKEDVELASLTIEFKDFDAEDDLTDLVLYADGNEISNAISINSDDEAVISLDFVIEAGDRVDFELEWVVTGSINDKVSAFITDIYAVGVETGIVSSITGDTGFADINLSDESSNVSNREIIGSEINISFDKSDIDEAMPSAEGVLIGTLEISSASDYTIDTLEVRVNSQTNDIVDIIDDMELDGSSYDSNDSASTTDDRIVIYTFEEIDLRAGETVMLDLVVDINDETSLNGEELTFQIDVRKVTDEENDEDYTGTELGDILSTTSLDDKDLDIDSASVTLTQSTLSQDEIVIGNNIDVILYKGKLSVGDSDTVTLNDITFDGSYSLSGLDLTDIIEEVVLNINGQTFDGDVEDDVIEFRSMNAEIAAGSDNLVVYVTATLKDNDNIHNNDYITIDNVDVSTSNGKFDTLSIEDSEGEDLLTTNVNVNTAASTTIVLNDSGTLDFEIVTEGDYEDDIKEVVLAGENSVKLAEIELEANDENMEIEDLSFFAAGVNLASTLDEVRLMNGSTIIADGATITYSNGDNGTYVTFEDEFVIENSSDKMNILLVADLNTFTTAGGAETATAVSMSFVVASMDVTGANSDDDITTNGVNYIATGTSLAVQVVPALVTVSKESELDEDDDDAEISFTIDQGNNDLNNDDTYIKSITFEELPTIAATPGVAYQAAVAAVPAVAAEAQVSTATIGGTLELGDDYTITVNGTGLTHTVSGTDADIDAVATALASAVNGLTGVSATATTNVVTITADTAGTAFTITTSVANNAITSDETNVAATPTANVVAVAAVPAQAEVQYVAAVPASYITVRNDDNDQVSYTVSGNTITFADGDADAKISNGDEYEFTVNNAGDELVITDMTFKVETSTFEFTNDKNIDLDKYTTD